MRQFEKSLCKSVACGGALGTALLFAVASVFPMPAFAFNKPSKGGGGGVSRNISVNSYLANNPTPTPDPPPYDVQGDGTNVISDPNARGYGLSAYYDGVDNVSSILTANTYNALPPGDWQLDMLSSAIRKVRINLSNNGVTAQDSASLPGELQGDLTLPGRLIEECTLIYQDITQMQVPGAAIDCPAVFRIPSSQEFTFYRLNMADGTGTELDASSTGKVVITCKSLGGNGFCNYWSIDPESGSTVAHLSQTVSSGQNRGSTLLGYFNLRFHIEVDETATNP